MYYIAYCINTLSPLFLDQPQEPEEVEKGLSPTRTPPSTPIRVEEGMFNQVVLCMDLHVYVWCASGDNTKKAAVSMSQCDL